MGSNTNTSSSTNVNDVSSHHIQAQSQQQQHERTFQLLATHAREQLEQQIKYLYKQLHDVKNEKQEMQESSQAALGSLQKEMKVQAATHAEQSTSLTRQIEEQKNKYNKLSNAHTHLQEDFAKMTEKFKTCQAQLAEMQCSNL